MQNKIGSSVHGRENEAWFCVPAKISLMMIRKSLGIIVLSSLVLHCASRVGLLSHIYQERHQIAFFLGIVDELPIALCGTSHFDSQQLLVHPADEKGSVPAELMTRINIVLFCVKVGNIDDPVRFLIPPVHNFHYVLVPYASPARDILHPPCV